MKSLDEEVKDLFVTFLMTVGQNAKNNEAREMSTTAIETSSLTPVKTVETQDQVK
jgi:hypothetical protein